MRIDSIRGKDVTVPMHRTNLALQTAQVAVGARPCVNVYGQRWAASHVDLAISMRKSNAFGATTAPALGRPPS